MNLGTCSECKATIIWAETPKRKRIALNPRPVMVAIGDPTASDEAEPVAVRPAYQIHFSTCAKRDTRIRR